MPISKRAKAVVLTQTAKRTREHKTSFIQEVRDAIDATKSVYLFSFENMRSNKFKNIRMHFRDSEGSSMKVDGEESSSNSSRIFLGKNKLLQIALGRSPEEEHADNLRHVSKLTTGSVGLLCSSRKREDVVSYFENMVEDDFARSGSVSPETVILTKEQVQTHPVSMVDQFRKLGLPVEIQNGRLGYIGGKEEHIICKEGKVLSVEACKLLVHVGIKLSEFKVKLVCVWDDGEFEMLS